MVLLYVDNVMIFEFICFSNDKIGLLDWPNPIDLKCIELTQYILYQFFLV